MKARGRGDRHPRADPAHPYDRRHAGRSLHGNGGDRPAPPSRPGLSGADRPRPRQGGDLPAALSVVNGVRSWDLNPHRRDSSPKDLTPSSPGSSSWTAASSTTSFATWQNGAARSWSSRRRRRGGDPRVAARRRFVVQWTRRSGGPALHRGCGSVDPGQGSHLRHLSWPPGLGQAAGGRTAKLKFGHHGINQPVKNRRNGRVEITSQNHGFVVLPESLTQERETFLDNLNDHTSEGIRYPALSAFSVQHHPEAAPGPHDADYLFDEFIHLMEEGKGRNDVILIIDFRCPVQPAHRPAGPGTPGLLPDQPPGDRTRRSGSSGRKESSFPAALLDLRSKRAAGGKGDLRFGIPILGICYGLQFMVDALGRRGDPFGQA